MCLLEQVNGIINFSLCDLPFLIWIYEFLKRSLLVFRSYRSYLDCCFHVIYSITYHPVIVQTELHAFSDRTESEITWQCQADTVSCTFIACRIYVPFIPVACQNTCTRKRDLVTDLCSKILGYQSKHLKGHLEPPLVTKKCLFVTKNDHFRIWAPC